ncbi:MAG TPA: hypothetical protein ENI95_04345 [Chloroflexi bacterium]|nr:hypothetical protein [Chloroflexota bacterium]
MTRTFDELMKRLEEKGKVSDEEAAKLISELGPLTDEEKKKLAQAYKEKAATKKEAGKEGGEKEKPAKPEEKEAAEGGKEKEPEKDDEIGEVTMDEYLQALSTLDSTDVSEEEKAKARKIKEKFESQ